jgi:DNA-directed RNA polymerase specialized sigma24 family protein
MAFSETTINEITAYQPDLVDFLALRLQAKNNLRLEVALDMAWEIAQDAMLAVLQASQNSPAIKKAPKDIPAFMQKVAMAIFQKKQKPHTSSDLTTSFQSHGALNMDALYQLENVRRKIGSMGEKYRLIFALHFEDRWRAKKIAARLSMPYEEVKERIFCIQKRLNSLKDPAPESPHPERERFWHGLDKPTIRMM